MILTNQNLQKKKKSHCISILLAFILIFALLFFAYQYSLDLIYTPIAPNDTNPIKIEIQKGDSVSEIADNLKKASLIENELVFWIYLILEGKQSSLQAGLFTVFRSQNIPEIVEILSKQKRQEMKITIPEGYTISQIDTLLFKKQLIDEGDFLRCASDCNFSEFEFLPSRTNKKPEGYLFPDTYYVFIDDFKAELFIKKLLFQFQIQTKDIIGDIKDSDRTLDDVINMASMIEKESRTKDEKYIISGILWKRLNEGIHLGVDATIRYYLDDWKNPLTYSDFQIDTTYNTRKYLGFPKTPISNPGIGSIKAAVYPKKTQYYYYLHDTSGNIHYAKNLDEHNRNKRQYLD